MKRYIKIISIALLVFFLCMNILYAYGEVPEYEITTESLTCAEILGPNLVKVVHAFIKILQISSVIIAIVYGMIMLVPAVASHDADALNKISRKLVNMAIVLVIILILPSLLRVFGKLLDYDISCIF